MKRFIILFLCFTAIALSAAIGVIMPAIIAEKTDNINWLWLYILTIPLFITTLTFIVEYLVYEDIV